MLTWQSRTACLHIVGQFAYFAKKIALLDKAIQRIIPKLPDMFKSIHELTLI